MSMKSMFAEVAQDLIAWFCIGRSDEELAALVNGLIGTSYSVKSVRCFRKNHRLRNGRDFRFKPGEQRYRPPKGIRRSVATEFRKGHVPHNMVPVGTEVYCADIGYWKRKVGEPNRWKLRARDNWERVNGPLGHGEVLIHLDQDRENDELSNLRKVSKKEVVTVGGKCGKLMKGEAEYNNAVISLAIIRSAVRNQEVGKQKAKEEKDR